MIIVIVTSWDNLNDTNSLNRCHGSLYSCVNKFCRVSHLHTFVEKTFTTEILQMY